MQRLWIWPLAAALISLGLNFWNLGQPDQLVSDEWYFIQEARNYAAGLPYQDAHPPLGKLQLAGVMQIFGDTPAVWRSVNAVSGALLVLVVWWVMWRLTRSPRAAKLAVLFALMDGFLLVEARSGLINLPLLLYGLLGFGLMLEALRRRRWWPWLVGSSIALGLSISVKWLGVLIALPVALIWLWPAGIGQVRAGRLQPTTWIVSIAILMGIPLAVYAAVFAVHFAWIGVAGDFWGTHWFLWNHHTHGKTGHLYAEHWWRWPVLWQPFPYWGEIRDGARSFIWSMGNPWLWWSSMVAVAGSLVAGWRRPVLRSLNIFVLCSWLPFALIQRDMFLYHAIPFGVFAWMILAIQLDRWWDRHHRWIWLWLALLAVVWLWFLPWYLNLPLTEMQHELRQWLPSWQLKA